MEKNGDIYLDKYAGWYSVRDEAYYAEERNAAQRAKVRVASEDRHAGRMGGGGELFLQALGLSAEAARSLQRGPNYVLPKERLNEVASFVRGGLQDLSISRTTFDWGIRCPASRQAHHVCVGRRADQLHHRRRLSRHRQREVQALLAGRSARHRQGHRALPRGLLAGVPDVGRHRGAAAHFLPRLSVQPRGENVEVGRQRDRPVRAGRRLRRRSAALFPLARGAVRPGRQLQPRGHRQPHQCRSRQRSRQSGAALADHGRRAISAACCRSRAHSATTTRRSWLPPTP